MLEIMFTVILEVFNNSKSFWDVSFKIGDVVLLMLLGFGAFQGYKKGIIIELSSLFLLIFIVYWVVTGTYWGFEAIQSNDAVSNFARTTTPFLVFLILVILLALFIEFVANLLKRVLKLMLFGSADSFLGSIFSLIKYCFSVGFLITLCIDIGAISMNTLEHKSILMPWVIAVFDYIVLLLDSIGVDIKSLLYKIEQLLRR